MLKDFKNWKEGKKVFKMKIVLKLYKILETEENYHVFQKVLHGNLLLFGIGCFIIGFILGTT